MTDLTAAAAFMATHARLLDRRRFDLLTGAGGVDAALDALAAYRNPDGGYGTGIEPDLRAIASQPVGALHAFEVFEEITPATSPAAAALCDWLDTVTLTDGGLPFALPIADPTGSATLWTEWDSTTPSLHLTCTIAGIAHRVGRHDPAVRDHPWLARATAYCWRGIQAMDTVRHALEYRYALQLLSAAESALPGADRELRRLGKFVPASGVLPVTGGAPDEAMRPLDFAPRPGEPVRTLFTAEAIAADLDRLAASQEEDGGWRVDWVAWSPAAELEWRGWATVRAVAILRANT